MKNTAFYFKTNTGFEYFWFNGIYLTIQDVKDEFFNLKPYSKIMSEQTFESSSFLQKLQDEKKIQTVTPIFFKEKLERAFEIIYNKL